MFYAGIIAIAKHEEPYIADWIKYHLGIGFEHIIIYNNDSPDRMVERIAELNDTRVTVHFIPGHPVQDVAYMTGLNMYRETFRWLCFLDIDEYIYTPKPLHETLKEFEPYCAVCPHWVLFGSNSHKTYSPEPVPERFTRCQQDVNRHVKSIVNPKQTGHWVTAHRFTHPVCPVDENFRSIGMLDSIPEHGTINKIYIAHYFTKSLEEFTERRSRPRPDTGEHRYILEEAFAHHDRNERENFDIRDQWRKINNS